MVLLRAFKVPFQVPFKGFFQGLVQGPVHKHATGAYKVSMVPLKAMSYCFGSVAISTSINSINGKGAFRR